MYLWNTKNLAIAIAHNKLSADDKFYYLLISNILLAVAGYVLWSFAIGSTGFEYWFEAFLILIVTTLGTLKCKKAFGGVPSLSLIESFIILGLPLLIKFYLVLGIAHGAAVWAFNFIETSVGFKSLSSAESYLPILNGIYAIHPLVIAVAATSWFYWRMAFYLSLIAENAPNTAINRSD